MYEVRLDDNDGNDGNRSGNRYYRIVSDKIPARIVLYFLSWSGFLVSFMLRNDINFALVAMVGKRDVMDNQNNSGNSMAGIDGVTNVTTLNVKHRNIENGEFEWSPGVQSIILGSFYWWYVLSQVVGGMATQYFGTKAIFGWSQFATAMCSILIPYAANIHYGVIILLRSIQGFASGLTWPAMYAIVGYWIPSNERSRFMSSFQGFSIGIGLTYPLCGFIIANWGWRLVFYTTGSIGLMWCVLWYLLAFNTPQIHPRITATELHYIECNISDEIKNGHGMSVPWRHIFKSLPVWSIGITTFGRIWIHYQFIMSGPMYMKNILGFSIQENGVLSGTPFLLSYVSSVLFCWIADALVIHKRVTLINVRKFFTFISQIAPGLLIVLIVFLNDYITLVLIIWFIAVSLITASYAGAMANIVDIAPNLAGPVLAFAQTIHMTASFVSPIVTGILVSDKESLDEWKVVFGISAFISIVTYLMYQIFGTADIQKWNYPLDNHHRLRNGHPNNSNKTNGSVTTTITLNGSAICRSPSSTTTTTTSVRRDSSILGHHTATADNAGGGMNLVARNAEPNYAYKFTPNQQQNSRLIVPLAANESYFIDDSESDDDDRMADSALIVCNNNKMKNSIKLTLGQSEKVSGSLISEQHAV